MSQQLRVDFQADPGNSRAEVNRQFAIHQCAGEHQIESQQPVRCEVHLNVVGTGRDLDDHLAVGVVLLGSNVIQIRHDKGKQRSADAVGLRSGAVVERVKAVEQFLTDPV